MLRIRWRIPPRSVLGQDGTSSSDVISDVAVDDDEGSMIFAGYTAGSWDTVNLGEEDWAAFKLDSDRNIVWTWQVTRCRRSRVFRCV